MYVFKQKFSRKFAFKAEPESMKFCLFRSIVYLYTFTNKKHEIFKHCIVGELLLRWERSDDQMVKNKKIT